MKLFERILALVLAALFVGTLFAGCVDAGDGQEADESEEAMTYLDALPAEYDMDGLKIRIWAHSDAGPSLITEEVGADLVSDAVFERNNIVEKRFNMKLDVKVHSPDDDMGDVIRNATLTNTDDFDICTVHQYAEVRLAQEGILMNLANQENLDFSREYWGSDMIDGMAYKNAKYWCTGDIFQNYIGGMYVTFLNKQLWEDYYPGVDYYQMVSDGEWTLDKMDELCSKVYEDVNRNTEKDVDDVFGTYVFHWTEIPDAFYYATGIAFTERDELGTPALKLDMEHINQVHRKLKKLFFDNDGVLANQGDLWLPDQLERFAADKTLFMATNLFYAEREEMRNMESDYAILPMPKLNEEQADYITILHDGTSLMGIPITNRRLNETTMVMEALASESYRTVTPVYYDLALKFKYVRDDVSGAMIDMIREGVTGDFAYYYHIGSLATGEEGDWTSITYVLRGVYETPYVPIVSSLKQYQNKWENDLATLLAEMERYSHY